MLIIDPTRWLLAPGLSGSLTPMTGALVFFAFLAAVFLSSRRRRSAA